MGADAIVGLGRTMLIQVAILVAPVLALVVVVSFIINIIQVLVSLQDQTLSAVPRLLATGTTLFFLMPWMWRHLALYTISLFSDFHAVLQ